MVNEITRHVNIILNTVYKQAGMNKFVKGSTGARNTIKKLSKDTGIAFSGMGNQLNKANLAIDKNGKLWNMSTGGIADYGHAQRKLRANTQRFHMELLSVMFAGMALQRTMQGLLQPTKKLTGETEIWGNTLAVFFLPYAMDSLNWAIGFQQAAIGINKATDGWAGRISGWGAAVGEFTGGLLAMVGQMGLAIIGFSTLYDKFDRFKKVADVVLSFGRKGWSLITGALGTLKSWGLYAADSIKKTINASFLRSGWGTIMGAIMSLKGWAAVGFAIGVIITLSWVGWEIGTRIGDWINKNFLGGKNVLQENIMPFLRDNPLIAGGHIQVAGYQGIANFLESFGSPPSAFGNWGYSNNYGDFLWRAGQSPIAISPQDTVMGMKDTSSMGGTMIFNPTINVTATSNVDIDRLTDQLSNEFNEKLKRVGMR